MKSPPEDPFFTQMKTIYIYHHVYGKPSIEHPVEEYNHFCYLEPVPEIIDLRNSTSFNPFVDEDCSSVNSSEFHKTDIKTNNQDTNVVSCNTSDSGSNVTSSTKKNATLLLKIRDNKDISFPTTEKSDTFESNKDTHDSNKIATTGKVMSDSCEKINDIIDIDKSVPTEMIMSDPNDNNKNSFTGKETSDTNVSNKNDIIDIDKSAST